MTIINTLNELAIYSAGRNPKWSKQPSVDAPNGPPTSPSDGVALQGAVVALIGCDMRTGLVSRAYVTIDGWDATADYTVTIDGTPYTVTAEADEPTTLVALKGAIGSAVIIDGRLVVTTENTVAVSATGTGTMAQVGDATAVDVVVWGYSGGIWRAPTNAALSLERSLGERALLAGYERAYIEVVATDGVCTPDIGPCGLEG